MTAEHPEPLTPAQRRSALEAFARALRREAHILHQRPEPPLAADVQLTCPRLPYHIEC
jgi:hypothetical protein